MNESKKISALPQVTDVTGSEELSLAYSGKNFKMTPLQIAEYTQARFPSVTEEELVATTGAGLVGTTRGGNLAVVLSPVSVLNGGGTSHTDGSGNTLTGSARWFLGNATPSIDDSALLIGRALAGSYVTGAHAVRDESSYNASGAGLLAYASYDAIPTFSGSANYNHYHAFQARGRYAGTNLMNEWAGFTHEAVVDGPTNAVRGLQVADAVGSGVLQEQAGVYVNDLTKGAAANYGAFLNLSAGAGKYNIRTGTAESLFNGIVNSAAGQKWAGTISVTSGTQRINLATNTNFVISGSGTITQISALNDASNAYTPLFQNAQVFTWNPGGAEGMRFDGNKNLNINTISPGASAVGVLCLGNGTEPTNAPADTVQFYSRDYSAGNTIPSFRCEGSEVLLTGQADAPATKRLRMCINGNFVNVLVE